MTVRMVAFLEEAAKDKAFLEKLQNAQTPQALIALAAEKGFQLTAEDIQPESASGELSDDELEDVAGGVNNSLKFGNDILKMAQGMKKQYNGFK